MKTPPRSLLRSAALLAAWPTLAWPQADTPATENTSRGHTLERVVATGGRPTTLPVEIPTTTEGITADEIARRINATDAEDVLKYFPSLNVRKRYIGDHDHAVLATRASGSGNSARSLVYADGMLLSNLLGNGASFTPRWGLVTPEEIERADVLYGPFSAAYSGNSVGAVVDYVTRMPERLEAHLKLHGFTQRFKAYGEDDQYSGGGGSASLGSREGRWSWWVNVNRLDSDAQPMTFANKLVSTGVTPTTGTPVSGAVPDRAPNEAARWIVGSGGQTHTVQDHAKLKLANDLTPTLRAAYTLGYWRNTTDRAARSYLRDASGNVMTSGNVVIDGLQYALSPTDFATSHGELEHLAQGFSLKSNTRGTWDWEASTSRYDYRRDKVQTSAMTGVTGAAETDMNGTGWITLALKGIWRPQGEHGVHIVEGGLQRDSYELRSRVTQQSGATPVSAFTGDSVLQSLWAQDAWRFAPAWRAVLGGRLEQWQASDGTVSNASSTKQFGERDEVFFSPKAAVSYEVDTDWTLKASVGRAVRMPTVAELYQGTYSTYPTVNNPDLKPERSWTSEWTVERALERGLLRATLFHERTQDALYSQTNSATNVTSVQNVDEIRTTGIELAAQGEDAGIRGLDLGASLTFADSIITRNDAFPASVGKWQPRVPRWRASGYASYRAGDAWTTTLGMRYSGTQYGTLDNTDPNGNTYMGFGRFFVLDLKAQYRFDRQWAAAFGVDNLTNTQYWAFHPYNQRTFHAELTFDL